MAELMVVTGGSRGIGRGIVEKALASGYRVAVVDVDAGHLDILARELDTAALTTAVLDITDPDAVDGWLTELEATVGTPAALVNNAGIVRITPLEDVTIEDWRAMLDVNLTGTFIMTQRVGRRMIANGGGAIVSIGSTASIAWTVGGSSYPPSKAAVAMLMRGVALEWGQHGIRANTVSPGYTMTADDRADLRRSRAGRAPAGPGAGRSLRRAGRYRRGRGLPLFGAGRLRDRPEHRRRRRLHPDRPIGADAPHLCRAGRSGRPVGRAGREVSPGQFGRRAGCAVAPRAPRG